MLEKTPIKNIKQVIKSAVARTSSYFESEYKIKVSVTKPEKEDLDSLTLLDMTVIIGMGGSINLLVAFSFQESLLDALFKQMTADFDVAPDEIEMYREASAGEVVNTILGHCTIDLQIPDGPAISMTPPVILDRVKTIKRMKNAMLYTEILNTNFGQMNISLVGPQELFDTHLDYIK
ncbi:MAG: chemotaxis protein CheX [Rhodocyclaceae bacterium]|nr:chemotaxis protein CheX [Rhodocyclaceae bacterium]